MGRSSVRKVLIALEIAGRVEIRTGTGVFVREPDDAEFSTTDLLSASALIESEIAALAARTAPTSSGAR